MESMNGYETLPNEKEPLRNRILEEDSFPERCWGQGKIEKNKASYQASKLGDQVITELTNEQQVE